MKNEIGCCSDNSSCCTPVTIEVSKPAEEARTLAIDFLYLDNETCGPCTGTESSLNEALNDVAAVLSSTGIKVKVNSIFIENEDLAKIHRFLSSPTIRINGHDLALNIEEESCPSCSQIAGEEISCRVWKWHGKTYSIPPKGMITEAILSYIYGSNTGGTISVESEEYVLPDNLKRFFAGKGCK